ncbi:MAG TPA: hypothetical protein VHT97_06760 [Acidimicrobiales bacterium]|jgi:hypothetical protein|nr:hypothetical protein [Acidimicrobiales bacterium]
MAGAAPIEGYLNDHLAGAAAAVQLIDTIRSNNQGTPLADYLDDLRRWVEEDRETLVRVMDALDASPSMPKQAGGKVVERLSRLRLNEHITGSADVSRLMEMETLSVGIEGKRLLWAALVTVGTARPQLGAFDLEALIERAVAQRAGLEPFRLEAAARALTAS